MSAQPEPQAAGGRQRTAKAEKSMARPVKLSRAGIIDGALTLLDREGGLALADHQCAGDFAGH